VFTHLRFTSFRSRAVRLALYVYDLGVITSVT